MSKIEKLTNDILRKIGSLSRAIHSISDIKYKELKLQKGQFTFLTRICENPGINFVDLSNMLKVDKTTTTKAVQKLIEAGYVDKRQDETDKRG
ncbi:MarR family winged helix-turn-helix transcriptional regulator, partial [Clostridioides difficile]